MPSPISRAARWAPKRASACRGVARVVAGLHPAIDDRRPRRDDEQHRETGEIGAKRHGVTRARCWQHHTCWRAGTRAGRFARGPIRVRDACRTSTRCARRCARTTSARCARGRRRRRRSRVRFERFFTELRDPLLALYGDDPRFADAWERLLRRDRRHRRGARRASCARSTTSARSRRTGSSASRRSATSTYVDRFAGTLRGRPRAAALPARARRHLPAPDAAAARAAGAQRRRLRGGRLRRGRAVAGHAGRPARAGGRPARGGHGAVRRPRAQPHRGASTRGRAAHPGRFYRTFPDRDASPTRYERTLPEVFPDTAPGQLHVGRRSSALGLDDVQRLPVGPRLHEPGRVRGHGRGDARPRARSASTCCGSTPRRSCGSGSGPTARTSPRSTSCCRRSARRCGSPRPAVAFKAEAIVAPRDLVPYLGTGRHEGKECDLAYHNVLMVLLWSALASRPGGADDAARCARCRRCRRAPGWLTYVRCHDDIGWAITPEDAARVGRGRVPAPALPGRLLRGRVPGHVRARRALPARPAHGRGAHSRHLRVAGGPGERAGRRGRRARGAAHAAPARAWRSPTAGCR